MYDEIYNNIENDPRFQRLVKRRQKFAWTLSLVMLAIYYIGRSYPLRIG